MPSRRAAFAPLATVFWFAWCGLARADEPIDVWLDLSLQPLASLPRDRADERMLLRERIQRQQDAVMRQLEPLGAIELARVQQVRNALAVRLPASALEAARALPDVRSVRRVRHRHRPSP